MNKTEALNAIRRAKSAHIKWRSFAQALIAGVPVTDDKVPKRHTDCDFGKWYYGAGHGSLGDLDSFRAIESPHEMLHAIYARIYSIYSGEGETWLQRFLSTKAKLEQRRQENAKKLMEELIDVSESLLKSIEILEQEVHESKTIPD